MLHTSNHRLAPLGGSLLGAAAICLLGATPLPSLMRFLPFPGGPRVALGSGCLCLFTGILCLLLDRWQKPCGQPVEDEQGTEPRMLQEELLERYPDLISQQELEQFPQWLLQAIYEHGRDGHETMARRLLEEWRDAPASFACDEENAVCQICGREDAPTCFTRCALCRQLVHGRCSTEVHRAYQVENMLVVDPQLQPFCQSCLEILQTRGWQLSQDGERVLLIRQRALPDEHEA
jgi:hypothetical protein